MIRLPNPRREINLSEYFMLLKHPDKFFSCNAIHSNAPGYATGKDLYRYGYQKLKCIHYIIGHIRTQLLDPTPKFSYYIRKSKMIKDTRCSK
jgi:hypothetical protein